MSKISVLGVGDLILGIPEIAGYFEAAKDVLKSGDVTICHVETPHTTRGQVCNTEPRLVPAAPPENLDALADCGFNVASFGGNHTFDQGYFGVTDTLDYLRQLGLKTCGAGENIAEARKPALIEKNGLKVAVLEYNCIGPNLSWATPMKAGAAFIRVSTIYESELCEPASMPTYCWTAVDPWSLQNMSEDITGCKNRGNIVIVSLHIGRMYDKHLLPYEFEITNKAIDAGAEMILCHHAHEPRGIRIYKGKPVFHGLGNFVTLTTMMNFDTDSTVKEQSLYKPYTYQGVYPTAWKRDNDSKEHETGIPNYVFSHMSRNTLIAKAVFDDNGLIEAGFFPCRINDKGIPTPVTKEDKGTDVLDCFKELNRIEELDDDIFNWSNDGREVKLKLI